MSESTLPITVTRKELKELWLHVTYRCNLTCKHCLFSCSPTNNLGELTLTECQSYVLKGMQHGVKALYITGGEPLIWPWLSDFLQWYYALETVLPLTILTNGTLITADMAKMFQGYVGQGLNLRISMECYTQTNHEAFRGQGSFDQVLQGIRNLNNFGIRPMIAFVNKSGGDLCSLDQLKLEGEFREKLKLDYGLEIKGLKIIAAYGKGRFAGLVHPVVSIEQVRSRLETVQCAYGVAVSKGGVYPCPIMVDVPESVLVETKAGFVGQSFELNYDFCLSCFATGSCCG